MHINKANTHLIPAALMRLEDGTDLEEGRAVRHVGQQQQDRVYHILGSEVN